MRREMDLIRLIVLQVESDHESPNTLISYENFETDLLIEGYTANQVEYHLQLAMAERFFSSPRNAGGLYIFTGLTPEGHDFADTVRDEKIWAMTKNGALKAGGFTLDLLGKLAKGFAKKQLEKHTGIEL